FRGVERSVDFLLSPRLGQAYQHLKEQGTNLPLVGRAVFLPSVEAAEGVTRFFLVIVQAPLPSAESVANVAEVSMEGGKRGLRVAFRELYFYMDLIDQQMTRTMTRAQWDILGYGPYSDLPLERREEVVDRACEKYLSLEHPIQRYEFLAHIRWHNAALHDDLVQTGLLRRRADAIRGAPSPSVAGGGGGGGGGGSDPFYSSSSGSPTFPGTGDPATTATRSPAASTMSASPSPFAGDAWLDANAVWRMRRKRRRRAAAAATPTGTAGKATGAATATTTMTNTGADDGPQHPSRYYLQGVVTGDVSEDRVGWFRRSGGAWALVPAGEGEGVWKAFSARE
ncbi:unnamed protein product, partial [Hapterophycus canaliculatus]